MNGHSSGGDWHNRLNLLVTATEVNSEKKRVLWHGSIWLILNERHPDLASKSSVGGPPCVPELVGRIWHHRPLSVHHMNFCAFTGWCHGILIIGELSSGRVAVWKTGCLAHKKAQRCRFLLIPAKQESQSTLNIGEHWSLTELLLRFSNSWTHLVDLCPPQHLWGRELFDRVKGSPSIRPCVLILALGRFPIDYLTTQKHCTSLDRPTRTRPNQSWPSVYLAC